jgi:6-phosphogluconolactonase
MRAESTSVDVFSDVDSLMHAAADHVARAAETAVADRGRSAIALSGGSTPRRLYELLAREPYASRIDWERTHFFWGDERAVSPGSPDSNYRMALETLLGRVPVPVGNVHRIRGEEPAELAAALYEETLRGFFGSASPDSSPGTAFDVALLGMGADGHVASIFPGTPAVHEKIRWVVANRSPEPPSLRITLTPVLFNASANALFLVAGREKAEALFAVLEGRYDPDRLPAQAIRPTDGWVRFMTDQEAARHLDLTR